MFQVKVANLIINRFILPIFESGLQEILPGLTDFFWRSDLKLPKTIGIGISSSKILFVTMEAK